MTPLSHFDVDKFNHMVAIYREQGYSLNLPDVKSYDDFSTNYPYQGKAQLSQMVASLQKQDILNQCYMISTSGSSGKPVILGNRILHSVDYDSYPFDIRRLLEKNIFNATDVVSNMLVPGCFGFLYEGLSRILYYIGATVLPVGRFDKQSSLEKTLSVMETSQVNTLIATPAGVMQLVQYYRDHNYTFPVKKIVYIGEMFHSHKRDRVRECWPQAEFYGLYGTSETGMMGINLPAMPINEYRYLAKWFFAETDETGKLYITDLRGSLIPIIRYHVGDTAQPVKEISKDISSFVLGGRSDSGFNICGNLISATKIKANIGKFFSNQSEVQFVLSNTNNGMDLLVVNISYDKTEDQSQARDHVMKCLYSDYLFYEGVARNSIKVDVVFTEFLELSNRMKYPLVVDKRH
ncbi:AMP-binding protein [Rahnella aceris]